MKKTSTYQLNGTNITENAKQVVKSTAATVQNSVQSGLAKTQDVLLSGLDATQDMVKRAQKSAAKNLKRAQKKARKGRFQGNVQPTLAKTQDALQTGIAVAQAVLAKNAKRANKNLKKAQKNIQGMSDSLQSRRTRAARKRTQKKFLFRLGLLTGLVLVLFYAPWPGSETRRQLVSFWQGLFQNRNS